MQIQEGVKVVFGGDAAGLLSAANVAKGGIAGLAVFSVAKMAQMDRAAIKTQRQWERSLTEIATLSNFTSKEIGRMRDEMRDLSLTTGQTFDKLAKARYDTISAGFTSAADSAMLLDAAAKGAVGGLTDIATSSKALITILNAYEMEAKDAARVNDLLFTTVQQGVTTYGELASEIGEVASTAKAAKLPLEDLLALVATVTRGGISTPEAVTAINQFLLAFVKQGPEARRVASAFNLDLSDMSSTMQTIAVMGERDLEMLTKLVPSVRGLKAAVSGAADEGRRFNEVLAAMGRAEGAGSAAAGKMGGTGQQLQARLDASRAALSAAWGENRSRQDRAWLELMIRINQELAETIDQMGTIERQQGRVYAFGGAMGSGASSLAAAVRANNDRRGPAAQSPFIAPGYGVIDPSKAGAASESLSMVDRRAAELATTLGYLNLAVQRVGGPQSPRVLSARNRQMDRWGGSGGPQTFNLRGGLAQVGGGISESARADAWAFNATWGQMGGGLTDSDRVWNAAQRRVQTFNDVSQATLGNLSDFTRNGIGNALADAFGAGESAVGAFAAKALTDLTMVLLRTLAIKVAMKAIGLSDGGMAPDAGDAVPASGLPGFAWGGYTGGAVDKYRRAGIVHAGEFVLNQEATRRIGVGQLERLNRGGDMTVNVGGIHINGTGLKTADDFGRAAADAVVRGMRQAKRTGAARLATGFGG